MDNRFTFVDLFFKSEYTIYHEKGLGKFFKTLNATLSLSRGRVKRWNKDAVGDYLYFRKRRVGAPLSKPNCVEYFVVPSLLNPRWIILNDQRAIQNHGLIIKPSSVAARLVWSIAKVLNKLGLFSILFPYRIVVCGAVLGDAVLNRRNECPSIMYTGAPGEYQKFTIQYVNRSFQPEYFLKISNSIKGKERIENESFALTRIEKSGFRHVVTPKVLDMVDGAGFFGLLQSNILFNESVDIGFVEADAVALSEMFNSLGYKKIEARRYIEDLLSNIMYIDLSDIFGGYEIFKNKEIILSSSHGDYIPWNRFVLDGSVKLIDWETMKDRPLFYDLCYFIVHKSILAERKSMLSIVEEVKIEISRMIVSMDVPIAESNTIDLDLYVTVIFIELYVHYKSNESLSDLPFLALLIKGLILLGGELHKKSELNHDHTIS